MNRFRLPVDIAMALLLLPVVAQRATKLRFHEHIGVVLLLLFIAHIVLNANWYRRITKGRYPIYRKFEITNNILLTLTFSIVLISSLVLAKYVFNLHLIGDSRRIWKGVHYISSYWFLLFLGIHIGLHWQIVLNKLRAFPVLISGIVSRLIVTAITCGGLYTLFATQMIRAMFFLRRRTVFPQNYDTITIYLAFISVIGLWIILGHYLGKYLHRPRKKAI